MSKKMKADVANELPAELTALAQKSVDQAEAAFEKANELAHSNVQAFDAAAGAYKTRLADLQLRAMEITQINVNAGFALARKMFAAREVGDMLAMQQEFFRDQSQVMQRQFAELNELAVALTKDTVKPVQEGLAKSFGEWSKSFAA